MKSFIKKLIPKGIKKYIKRKFTRVIYKTNNAYVIDNENMPIKGKNAVVTGGNGELGHAICVLLAARGANVYVSGRNSEKVGRIVKEIREMGLCAFPMIMDVSDDESISKAFKKEFADKKVDITVCCAGGGARAKMASLTEQTVEVIDEVLNINLRGSMLCAREAAKYMPQKGRIIIISSAVGILGKENYSEYAAAKSGMFGFVKSLALELGKKGITVNCISPGIVQREEYTESERERIVLTNCLHDMCTAEDVAEAVCFIASDKARFITGQNLVVDGGRTLGLYGDR